MRLVVIDATEPLLWVAVVAASVAALLLGRAVGRKGARNGGTRGLSLAVLDLLVFSLTVVVGEVLLLSLLVAWRTGAMACMPLVRQVLLIPVAVCVITASVAWCSARKPEPA